MPGLALVFDLLARDKATPTLRKVADQTERVGKASDGLGRASKIAGTGVRFLGKTALGVGAALGGVATAAGGIGIKTAAGMETARIGFTTMLGSATKADKFLRNLSDFAAKTPFEFPELQTAASSLISAGVNADKVIPIMRTLGDVTAGMGTGSEGIQRATVALQQMQAAGRITGEDLNQLRDAGIPVYDLLAKATGKSKEEVVKLAQAGKLGKTELDAMMKALETGKGLERFNGLMAKTSQSMSGLWSTLKDSINIGLAQAIQPAIPLIKDGLGGAIKAVGVVMPVVATGLGEFVGGIKAFSGALQRANGDVTSSGFPGFMERVANLIVRLRPLWTELVGGFRAFGAAFKAADGDVTSSGFAGVMERLGGLLATQVVPALRSVGDYVRTAVLPALVSLGQFIISTVVPAWMSWYGFLVKQALPILRQVGQFILTQVVPALGTVVRFIGSDVVPGFLSIVQTVKGLIRVVAPIIAEIVGVILGRFRELRPQIASIWNSVKEIITGVMAIIREVIAQVTEVIRVIWSRWGNQIKTIVGAIFEAIVKIISGLMKAIAGIIKTVVALIRGDWKGAWEGIKQIFSGIWTAIKAILVAAWTVIKTVFSSAHAYVKGRWDTFWTGIKETARSAMDSVRTRIGTVLDRIKTAFSSAKESIKRIWDGVKGVVSSPIEWVRNNVYNRPLVPVWNRVAGLVGGPKLATYATGGIIPGYTPGRDTHLIGVGGGEAVMRPEWTRAAGSAYVKDANQAARTGGIAGAQAFIASRGLPGFADGGIVGWIRNTLSSGASAVRGLAGNLKDWALGGLRSAAEKVLAPLRAVIRSQLSGAGVRTTVGGIANKALDLVLDKIKRADEAAAAAGLGGGGPVGAGGYANALAWARTQRGKPYIWTGVGPRGYDCSGFMSAILNVIRGRSPHARLFSTGMAGGATLAGMTRGKSSPFRIGVVRGNPGHTAGTLNGVNVESSGGVGVRVGGGARGWNNRLFTMSYGLARGGIVGDAPFDTLNPRGARFDPAARILAQMLYGADGLARGGLVKGGRGGLVTRIGEGASDELVTPLPPNWRTARGDDRIDRLIAAIEQHGLQGPTFNFDIDNPIAEKASQTANRMLQRVAALPLV